MTIEKFRELAFARPLMPFVMHIADGRQISVETPDSVSTSQIGRIAHVFRGPDDASSFIDIMLVTALELKNGDAAKRHEG